MLLPVVSTIQSKVIHPAPSILVMESSSTTSMAVPDLSGICYGSAAGSQSGPHGSMPSQAALPVADLAAPPAAKRDRRSQSQEDGIITHHAAAIFDTSLDVSITSNSGDDASFQVQAAPGLPPLPVGVRSRAEPGDRISAFGATTPRADEFHSP